MERRNFLKNLALGTLAGSLASRIPGAFASDTHASEPFVGDADLVAIKGGEPEQMFDKAIEALGGLKRFVKKGQKVVVKPNIGWDVPPERAANTHPGLIGHIVKRCLEAGAAEVFVFDNTCDNWLKCYNTSGIEEAVKKAGGKIVPGNEERLYKPVSISGRVLKNASVHELILSCDVFINVPILKHHSSADVSIAMKNLMGIVWDRRWWHRNNLHQCIADFAGFRKPDLNVIDAYRVMIKNGPRGVSEADVKIMKSMIVSTDIVAADAAATKLMGNEPAQIGHIRLAHEMKIGNMDLSSLKIQRITV
ncbi:MAG: DUF362 domain-containing protein [Bacteroidales bacterium]|jgi:uncharacterized protein (DUF362 family)|nr:DUF362 domain-containing protein [Bacteroidales bacterium]NPV36612.1 DUF362 domain-containing protein [Bacteroidales bacterium]